VNGFRTPRPFSFREAPSRPTFSPQRNGSRGAMAGLGALTGTWVSLGRRESLSFIEAVAGDVRSSGIRRGSHRSSRLEGPLTVHYRKAMVWC
jgi:hypothetical protein